MKNPQTTFTVSLLAKEFHCHIREVLTPDELLLVDERNLTNGDQVCATHDVIDANVIMDEAFVTLMHCQLDGDNEDDVLLWNTAWGLAKCNGFAKDWDDRPRAG